MEAAEEPVGNSEGWAEREERVHHIWRFLRSRARNFLLC